MDKDTQPTTKADTKTATKMTLDLSKATSMTDW